MRDVYYHIGFHKTGTTFLQNKYFLTLPLTFFKGGQSYLKVISSFSKENNKVLISEENFSGELFSGKKTEQLIRNIKSIKVIHPNAKIIIGFRPHADFVLSAYKQALHQGMTISFEDFYNSENSGLIKNEDINFKNTIDLLKTNFSSIFIYTIDDVRNIERFNTFFSKFLEVLPVATNSNNKKVNRSVQSVMQVKILLGLNRFDEKFEKLFNTKILYSKIFKFLKITPRKICQNYLPDSGKKFSMDTNTLNYINETFKTDWKYVLENKSIKGSNK